MSQEPSADTGFVQRGFLLLGAMGVLVSIVLYILFGRAPSAAPQPESSPDLTEVSASPDGWRIQYSAAISLAKRNSAHVPWDRFADMLDEKKQLKNLHDGAPNPSAARSILLRALMTLQEWHEKQDKQNPPDVSALKEIYAKIDLLAQDPSAQIRVQAGKTQDAIRPFRKS